MARQADELRRKYISLVKVVTVQRSLFFLPEEVRVILVVFAHELADLREINARRKQARDGPRLLEHVRILNSGFILQTAIRSAADALDQMQILRVFETGDL